MSINKRLVIICNSSGFHRVDATNQGFNNTYLSNLRDIYDVKGFWVSSATVLHAKSSLRHYVCERDVILLHVGVSEAVTMAPRSFFHMASAFLNYFGATDDFMSFIAPKMLEVSEYILEHGDDNYYCRFLDQTDFITLYSKMLAQVKHQKVLVLGLAEPKTDKPRMYEQIKEYNTLIEQVVVNGFSNHQFVDTWNICKGLVGDSSHLTTEGHNKLFDVVQSKLEDCYE